MTTAIEPTAELADLPDAESIRVAAGDAVLGGFAWWQPHRAPAIVFAHGHGQDASFHADRARSFHARGWHAVSVATRGWPGSSGDPDDYGYSGETDLRAVLDVVAERDCSEVWTLGFSAGGLWTARGLSVAPEVSGAITVNAPMNLATLRRDTLASRMRKYYDEVVTPARWAACSPATVAEAITAPMLAFGGTEDGMVPSSQAREITAAVGDGTYVEMAGMRHVPTEEQWRTILDRTEVWMTSVREKA